MNANHADAANWIRSGSGGHSILFALSLLYASSFVSFLLTATVVAGKVAVAK